MQSAQALGTGRAHAVSTLAWPESSLYVSEKYRLVYCPIQKVACSSIKLWWAGLHGRGPDDFLTTDERNQTIIDHPKLSGLYRVGNFPHLGTQPLTDDDWFRVVFVRNPWSRLVSAFLNKFLSSQPLVRPVFKVVHRRWRSRTALRLRDAMLSPLSSRRSDDSEPLRDSLWPALFGRTAWEEEMTFRHFVEYLGGVGLNHNQVDFHWRPQYRFVNDLPFHYVGRFERLAEDIRTIASMIGVRAVLPSVNRTKYVASQDAKTCFADYSLRELRKLPSLPSYRQFYTEQLTEQVGELYRRDVEQFEYSFNG